MDRDWHALPIRVYYEDTGAQGVVYFGSYLRFMERGRTEWLRDNGIEQNNLREDRKLCFSLAETPVQFKQPARFDDSLFVLTRIGDGRGARFRFELQIRLGDAAGVLPAMTI